MPKRSADERIQYYSAKIKKLKKQGKEKRRSRLIVYSSSSDSEEIQDNGTQNLEEHIDVDETSPDAPSTSKSPDHQPPASEVLSTEPELDPELLEGLGDAVADIPVYGPDIHDKLAQSWLTILKKGIQSEAKETLLKAYTIPNNCKLLKAPTLNVEISAAVTDLVRNRDKKLQTKQDQLGLGISAINKAMTLLLTGDDKVQAVKILSDSCRILTDLHFTETQVRTKLMTPGLDKSFLTLIQDQDRDETLFGSKLPDKIKASKAIEKQGLQIKKAPIPKPSTSNIPTSSARFQNQGNWSGPPRFPSSRRGGADILVSGTSTPTLPPGAADVDVSASECGRELLQACPYEAITQDSPTPSETVYPGCSCALKFAFESRGTPSLALDLMMSSLSQNTLSQYNGSYKLWWQFCEANSLNPYSGSPSDIMLFLTKLFNKGASYGSLNSHRSALSLLLGNIVTSNDQVKRLLKGVYKLRPATPKYTCTWDPQVVLNFVAEWIPNRGLSIEKITKKLVVLLALCTAHRVQTFSLIKLENIVVGPCDIQIGISDVIKTSAAGREQPVLILPYFNENRAICPATIIEDYLFATKDIRSEATNSFILSYKRPHKPATAQTISRWIKQVLGASGVDVSAFSAHSTRHAATSAASALVRCHKESSWLDQYFSNVRKVLPPPSSGQR